MNTPFIDFKAQEITAEKQEKYFVKPNHLEKLISPKASLIFGERGSGKTTILKHLEKSFNSSTDFRYIGLYYRFETAHTKALYNPEITEDKNIVAFSQAMTVIIGKLLCEVLMKLQSEKRITFEKEEEICLKMMDAIEIEYNYTKPTFESLKNILEMIRRKTLINLQNNRVICYLDYTTFVRQFCEELCKESRLKETCFCVLLDEFENLTVSEQRVINSYIKSSSFFLTYKVCMRPDGFLTKNTLAEKEQLIFGHDYEEFDYVKDIVGSDGELRRHLREVCSNRLAYFYSELGNAFDKSALEVDNYLDYVDDVKDIETWDRIDEYKDELRKVINNYFKNSVEVINEITDAITLKLILVLYEKGINEKEIFSNISKKSDKYRNWMHNYKQNIIFQIISECEQTKKYCGFDTFVKLANGNARTVLEILHYAFGDYDEMAGGKYGTISIKRQTDAVNKVAELSFLQIDYIPVNGYRVKSLANALGNLFAEVMQDGRARKFETNSFSIKATTMLTREQTDELIDVLHDATVWGILIPFKATKIKNPGDIVFDGKDYMLHPILAPFFKISYRKKQKCELRDEDVYFMLKPGTRQEIDRISKEIKTGFVQQTLEW